MNVWAVAPLVGTAVFSCLHGEEPQSSLQWVNVSSVYRRFEDIKPKLANKGKVSVFLSRLYPNGSAQVQRFNSESGRWEAGEWSITCGAVAQATVPIEIKPNSEREIQVYWQLSTDRWENPQHFVIADALQERPLDGRYRFVVRYSLQPWTLAHHPSAIYSLLSPEFVLKAR
jgi:hypothetical protein